MRFKKLLESWREEDSRHKMLMHHGFKHTGSDQTQEGEDYHTYNHKSKGTVHIFGDSNNWTAYRHGKEYHGNHHETLAKHLEGNK